MTLTKTLLLFSGLFLMLAIIITTYVMGEVRSNRPALHDFQPTHFNFNSTKPIYILSDGKLHFSKDGKIQLSAKPIRKISGALRSPLVSPDSRHIAFNDNKERIIILAADGTEQGAISPLNATMLGKDRESGHFWGQHYQWNRASNRLYVMSDKVWVENYSPANRSTLLYYSLEEKKLVHVLDLPEECYRSFYLSPDEKSLFYSFSDEEGRIAYKQVSVASGGVENVFYKDDKGRIGIPSTDIFINYRNEQFGNFSSNFRRLVTAVGTTNQGEDTKGGLFTYVDEQPRRIIRGSYGQGNIKEYLYSFLKVGSFLPGNRYYVGNLEAGDISGTIIVDTESGEYDFMEQKLQVISATNSEEQPDFMFELELAPSIPWESNIQKSIRENLLEQRAENRE